MSKVDNYWRMVLSKEIMIVTHQSDATQKIGNSRYAIIRFIDGL